MSSFILLWLWACFGLLSRLKLRAQSCRICGEIDSSWRSLAGRPFSQVASTARYKRTLTVASSDVTARSTPMVAQQQFAACAAAPLLTTSELALAGGC